ncbi:MAG TPA: thiopeptide-type bacteriocin biosynthesis protein [Actinoplanes sp.]|nr:thiopeptide-type bacteriocin biosynthesis protein [Actinoplanes sp.]
MTSDDWLSVHVHYHGDLDRLLREAVRPLIAETGHEHFFVRHWQGGPHLRLRLRPAVPTTAALIEGHVGGFLTAHPSTRPVTETDYRAAASSLLTVEPGHDRAEPLVPDNTIQPRPYHPEYARYGGTAAAMRAVERHFTASSELVLRMLADDGAAGRRTGSALTMMLTAAMVAAGGPDRLTGHLGDRQRNWGRRLMSGVPDDAEGWFEAKYQRQRHTLVRTVEQVMELVESGATDRAGPALADWATSVITLRDELTGLRRTGGFTPTEVFMADDGDDADLRSVLLFCSHMHNNRLGVSLPEEAYLMYLLWRAVAEVTRSAR